MKSRLRVVAFSLLLLLIPSASTSREPVMSSSSLASRPVLSSFAIESWIAVTKRQQDMTFLAAWTPPKAQREGNLGAQAAQEAGDIGQVICSVFTEDCPRAIRVARCESNLNPAARNRSGALGLFQLLGHGDMFAAHGWDVATDWSDAYKNTVVAHDLWSSSGWLPWVCK